MRGEVKRWAVGWVGGWVGGRNRARAKKDKDALEQGSHRAERRSNGKGERWKGKRRLLFLFRVRPPLSLSLSLVLSLASFLLFPPRLE